MRKPCPTLNPTGFASPLLAHRFPPPSATHRRPLFTFLIKRCFHMDPQWTSVESMGYGSQQRSRPAPRTHTIGACRNTSTEGLWFFFFFSVNSLTPHLILASPMTVSHGRGAWYKSHSLLVPSMNTAMLTEKHNSSMRFDQVIATR